jgi:hypothetical protein
MKTTQFLSRAHTWCAILSVALGLWAFQARCQVNLVSNGGFEGGYNNGPRGWGWTYNVTLWSGFPGAAEGGCYAGVDGTLYQDLHTTPGQAYELRFAMAGNFNQGQVAELDIQWGSLTLGSLTWNPAGHSINNLGWVWGDFEVTATASTTRLTFENPNVGTQNIPLLDAVQVIAVPEPSSLGLVSLGILGGLMSRPFIRRRQAAGTGGGGEHQYTYRTPAPPRR